MSNVHVLPRPKGTRIGYVVEDHADHVLGTFRTQREAIEWATGQGHAPLVARVRHLNDKKIPDHWRSARSSRLAETAGGYSIADLSVVSLRHPQECDGRVLPKGATGTVVYVYDGGVGYEVEFEEPFHCVATVERDDIRPV